MHQELRGLSDRRLFIRRLADTTLAEIQKSHDYMVTFLTETASANEISPDLRAVCGEAEMGSDGFLATVRRDSDRLVWIAFFDIANPFVSIRFSDNSIIATNNRGEDWTFPLMDPASISVRSTLTKADVSDWQ